MIGIKIFSKAARLFSLLVITSPFSNKIVIWQLQTCRKYSKCRVFMFENHQKCLIWIFTQKIYFLKVLNFSELLILGGKIQMHLRCLNVASLVFWKIEFMIEFLNTVSCLHIPEKNSWWTSMQLGVSLNQGWCPFRWRTWTGQQQQQWVELGWKCCRQFYRYTWDILVWKKQVCTLLYHHKISPDYKGTRHHKILCKN